MTFVCSSLWAEIANLGYRCVEISMPSGQEDSDNDGVANVCDNCKYPNPLQIDKV